MTTMTEETISAAAIYRVTDIKTNKFCGWLVKSNHSDEYYHIHCYKVSNELIWTCTCKAGQYGFKGCKAGYCCHVTAVIEVEEARQLARLQEKQAKAEAEAAIAEVERQLAAERERKQRKPRRKKLAQQGESENGNGKEVIASEPFPGRHTTERARARAFAGFERDLAPLGPQTGFSLLK